MILTIYLQYIVYLYLYLYLYCLFIFIFIVNLFDGKFQNIGTYEKIFNDHSNKASVVDYVISSVGGLEFYNQVLNPDIYGIL